MDQSQSHVLGGIVDRLAAVNAQIKALKDEAAALRQSLIDGDQAFVFGQLHQAAISFVPGKVTTDWQSIARKLSPSRQLIAAHTSRGEDFYVVRVSDITA